MKKKFLSAMLLGLVALGISTTFVSCKDYDDDISAVKSDVSSLQTLTTSLQNTLSDLKTQLATAQSELATAKQNIATNTGDIATNKGNITTNTQNITDLTARVVALESKIKIAEEALDKAKTNAGDIAALKEDLQTAVNVLNGTINTLKDKDVALQNQIDVINTFLANPDYDSLAEAFADLKAKIQDAKDKEVEDVNSLQTEIDVLSTALNNEVKDRTAAINGVNVRIDAIWAELSIITADLRSLVYMPYLYVGGIESIEYPYVRDTAMNVVEYNGGWLTIKRESASLKEQSISIPTKTDWSLAGVDVAKNLIIMNPVTTVDYHLNPAGAKTDGDDMANYNVRGAELVGPSSRAAGSIEVNSPKTYANGDVAWKSEGGVFTAPFQVATTSWLNTSNDKNFTNSDNIVAFQAKTKKSTSADAKVVTSDYALVFPEEMHIEGLVYTKQPTGGNSEAAKKIADDETCTLKEDVCHVYDTPEEALMAAAKGKKGADFNVFYNGDVTLQEYLGVHFTYANDYTKAKKKGAVKTVNFVTEDNELQRMGITYEFHPVFYKIGGNSTLDSKYCTLDAATGKLDPCNIDANGEPSGVKDIVSVGRQPLVQVLVKYDGKVILDGYILVNISQQPIDVTFDYPAVDVKHALCKTTTLMSTTWEQFNKVVLTDGLKGWTKDQFDASYVIDNHDGITTTEKSSWPSNVKKANEKYVLNAQIYIKDATGFKAVADNGGYGHIDYTYDEAGTTNHAFVWTISREELEKFYHDGKSKTMEVYLCYTLTTTRNQHIYLHLTANISRPQFAYDWGTKINNYWYSLSGADGGYDAIVADVTEPVSGTYVCQESWIQPMINTIKSTGNKNEIEITNDGKAVTTYGKKFYFAPENDEALNTITDLDGVTYYITPKSSSIDKKYNHLYCAYETDLTKHAAHAYVGSTSALDYTNSNLDETLNSCAIAYSEGAFTNDKLYAYNVKTKTYTKFADLDQTTGDITIANTTIAQKLINAVGYKANKANIMNQLHAKVGVIAKSLGTSAYQCDVAQYIKNSEFYNSWERPINAIDTATVGIDAKTDNNYYYMVNLLRLYDWRGPSDGYMWGNQTWFWSFYMVHSITIDVAPAHVLTDLHQTAGSFVKLSDVTHKLSLSTNGKQSETYEFGTNINQYNKADQNADIVKYMNDYKKNFGYIVYANNGENVTKFTIKVPVTIGYQWGEIKTTLSITIDRTKGN